MPSAAVQESKPTEDSHIKIPGTAPEAPKKAVVIQEIGKTIPNFDIVEDELTVTMTLNVEEDSSAKDIDLEFSET